MQEADLGGLFPDQLDFEELLVVHLRDVGKNYAAFGVVDAMEHDVVQRVELLNLLLDVGGVL